ncbi:MAG: EGF-like domain-containing protein, partial [Myxococcales bacterium]|nr:EGF-like domain-containing protein [Myxococcales bacterium]
MRSAIAVTLAFMALGCAGEIGPEADIGAASDVNVAESQLTRGFWRVFFRGWLDRICTDRDGDYRCKCAHLYNPDDVACGDDDGGDDLVDECEEGSHDCDDNATCTDLTDGFACECDAGYAGDGSTCEDVDECAEGSDDCDENATCDNTVGGFTCECDEGYQGDGTTCEAAGVDECEA